MDSKRKKELLAEYKNRKPEMGVISFFCIETGDAFLGVSKDIKADFNGNRFKLNSNWHPNKRLLELWNKYGEESFELTIVELLEYEDPAADHSKELEDILARCLASTSTAGEVTKQRLHINHDYFNKTV